MVTFGFMALLALILSLSAISLKQLHAINESMGTLIRVTQAPGKVVHATSRSLMRNMANVTAGGEEDRSDNILWNSGTTRMNSEHTTIMLNAKTNVG